MTDLEIARRLEKLERNNRRLKRFGAPALVLAAALGAIYATKPVQQTITAHEFDAVDDAGRVRIRLATMPINTSVELLDAQGNRTAAMQEYLGFSFIIAGKDGGDVALLTSSPQSGSSVGVGYTPDWDTTIAGKSGNALRDALLSYQSRAESGPSVNMPVSPSGAANISLRDAQGFRTDLGSTGTVTPATGATQQTSAASIVMFGNDREHHLIWKAP
jgi:hypothetical protein